VLSHWSYQGLGRGQIRLVFSLPCLDPNSIEKAGSNTPISGYFFSDLLIETYLIINRACQLKNNIHIAFFLFSTVQMKDDQS
jgi:hypothetical protein